MDYYTKGKNIEHDTTRESIPITGLSSSCLWMKIRPSSKIKSIIDVAERGLRDDGAVLFSGYGPAVGKVVTCAEILKRKYPNSHQYNEISRRVTEEHWEPKLEDLEALKVVRNVPELFIALTIEILPGQSEQNKLENFLEISKKSEMGKRHQNRRRGNKKAINDLGMNKRKVSNFKTDNKTDTGLQ